MANIVGIVFTDENQIEYYNCEDLKIKKNITVIVQDGQSIKFGKVATDVHKLDEKNLNTPLGKIIRVATKKDYLKHQANLKKASQALSRCKQLVQKYKLDMNIIDANYTFDQDQLIFDFYAEARIDFRNLAKELASIYKTRIELHQIGVRDKAKKICGVGLCGQKICCSRFLKEFDSVSISMAKNQNLSLNPTKINGVCGRLLCCLKYEDECYKECKKDLPNIGQTIEVNGIIGKVVFVDILRKKYSIETSKKEIIEVDVGNH